VAAGVRWWLLVSAAGGWCPLLVAGVRCWWLVSAAGGVPHHVGTPPAARENVNKPFILD